MICSATLKAAIGRRCYKQQEHDEGTDGKAGKEEFKQEGMTRGEKSQLQIENLFKGQYRYRCFQTDVANNRCAYSQHFLQQCDHF